MRFLGVAIMIVACGLHQACADWTDRDGSCRDDDDCVPPAECIKATDEPYDEQNGECLLPDTETDDG